MGGMAAGAYLGNKVGTAAGTLFGFAVCAKKAESPPPVPGGSGKSSVAEGSGKKPPVEATKEIRDGAGTDGNMWRKDISCTKITGT